VASRQFLTLRFGLASENPIACDRGGVKSCGGRSSNEDDLDMVMLRLLIYKRIWPLWRRS
jgi:hypothetical protein